MPTKTHFVLTTAFKKLTAQFIQQHPNLAALAGPAFLAANGMPWPLFVKQYQWTFHSMPHFSMPKIWGDFWLVPGLVQIYAALEVPDGSSDEVVVPEIFWTPPIP